jgi:hypothetical protein
MINADPDLNNKNAFCVKLPYVAGGRLLDGPSFKYGIGIDGIFACIKEFVKWNDAVLGYIPFVIVQPKFRYTTEAKVSKYYLYYIYFMKKSNDALYFYLCLDTLLSWQGMLYESP